MVGGFLLAAWYATDMSLGPVLAIRIRVVNFVLFLLLLLLWYAIFSWAGMYRSSRLSSVRWVEVCRVVQATSLGTIAVICAANVFNIRLVTQPFAVAFWTATTVLYIVERLLLNSLLESMRRRGRNLRHLLIVGTNARACGFARKIEARQELGYRILGFVDDEWAGMGEFQRSGRQLLTTPERLLEFLRENVVDEVVIALPLGSHYDAIAKLVGICEEQGITVRFLSDLFNLKLAKTTVEVFEDEPVMTMGTGSRDEWAIAGKRLVDIVLSSLALIALSPLLLATALAVKLTSPGPVLFTQQRVGLNKRKFHLHKFRTMVADAEQRLAELEHLNEVSGPVFKIKNDPRLTPIGRILRKTSIDELPQLLDVLRGEMSLVGPRPLPVRDYQGFDKDWHRRRFSVRPGITCLWQVNGRSSLAFDRWMELDMQYIDQWSLLLDLKILVRTIPAVFRGSGAA
jgi:exopolysaccharide biosynthesis polyprenyl glycosylphosphotransferase